jgi:hypothetical protein
MIKRQCKDSIAKFEDRVSSKISWISRGVLVSEGFALCAMADLYDVDLMIESGVYYGRSTLMFAKYGKKTIAVDIAVKQEAKDRLQKYDVTLIEGSGIELLPKLIKENTEHKIGVFIDGPKGVKGAALAGECYKYDNVMFVGIHDIKKVATDSRAAFNKIDTHSKFFTDEEWFVEAYKYLDKGDIAHKREFPHKQNWEPYVYVQANGQRVKLGSYGPTVGVLLK